MKKTNLYIFLPVLLFFSACTPEEFDTVGVKVDEISPEYAVPVIHSVLSPDQILKPNSTSFIRRANDGFLSLVYRGNFFSANAENLVNLPNQDFNQTFTLTPANANALSNGQSQTISLPLSASFAISGKEIDSLWLKAGTLAASISSQIKTGGNLRLKFQDVLKAGVALNLDIPFTYTGAPLPVTASKVAALVGHHWDMTKGNPAYNVVNLQFELTLNPTTYPVMAGEQLSVDFSLSQMRFSRFYGYIGTLNMASAPDSIELSIFDNSKSGQFTIDDAIIKVITGNSFGMPVSAGFSTLTATDKGGNTQAVTGLPNPLPIAVPDISQAGQTLRDSARIDKTNSNLVSVINNKPVQIVYKPYITLNPGGKQQRNFLLDNSRIDFDVQVELPLYGTARDFVMESENALEANMPENDLIETVMLRFTGINGFPLDLATQVYLLDSAEQVFDSIFLSPDFNLLESAAVGLDGKVSAPKKKTTDIVFDAMRAKRLGDLKKLKLRAEMATLNNSGVYPPVKIYSNYTLELSVGIKVKLRIKADKL